MPKADGTHRRKRLDSSRLFKGTVVTEDRSLMNVPFVTGDILPLFDKFFGSPQYLLTGVLGPESNAHGPNEMLRLDYLKKLTRAVAQIVAAV